MDHAHHNIHPREFNAVRVDGRNAGVKAAAKADCGPSCGLCAVCRKNGAELHGGICNLLRIDVDILNPRYRVSKMVVTRGKVSTQSYLSTGEQEKGNK